LIKDHKKADEHGNFPTRLVVPASNFTSSFPKAGYLGIKKIFDENEINYMDKTIIQASDLKEELEKLGIKSNNTTIVSIDAEAYYPSIKLKLVRKAVKFYSEGLNTKEKDTINHCLDMIKFGMCNTLITFEDQYYEYDGGKDPEEKGLTIGGFESAWLADLVGAYILANTQQHFTHTTYHGLYRDDGFATFTGDWDYDMIVKWRNEFQDSVNTLAEGDYLQFTCSIWLPNEKAKEHNKMVSIERGKGFPYLDMELIWSEQKELQFQVYMKPNQQLKYLNKGSTHTGAVFKAIPKGVYQRLAKLTTMTEMNGNLTLKEIYPKHFKALEHANLVKGKIPTLRETKLEIETLKMLSEASKAAKEKKGRERKRAIYFCAGYSKTWITPIHKTIQALKDRFELTWLRFSMSYHRFTNLRETLQGDLQGKINLGVESKDFMKEDCNCKGNKGDCNYDGICRDKVVVYEITCKDTGMVYIGQTQQNFKGRMVGHHSDVSALHNPERITKRSDSYAKHFAHQLQNWETVPPKVQREHYSSKILWQGNPISAVKTFGTQNCTLCNRERLEIFKRFKNNPQSLINSCGEIYGGCLHRPKFHRYSNKQTSTDDSKKDEKVKPRKATTEV
jgi:hypothetical protein